MAQIQVRITRGMGQDNRPANFAHFQMNQMHPNGKNVVHGLVMDFVPLGWPGFRTPGITR